MNTNGEINSALKSFLNSLVDYAGLFPPASLNLAQAFNNYIMYLQGDYSWALSRFVIPAKKLPELEELMGQIKYPKDLILPFSVLATNPEGVNDFEKHLERDIELIGEFAGKFGSRVKTDVLELRLPADAVEGSSKDLSGLMKTVTDSFKDKLNMNVTAFYEAALKGDFENRVIKAAEAISFQNGSSRNAGFKLRTGGVEAAAFPAPGEISFALITCIEYDVPMKCTAGLHHPIRHYDESLQTNMHGFLNVFGAGIFAQVCNLDEDETLQILTEEDPYAFHFTEEGIEINDFVVSKKDLELSRKKFMLSYGSCSFDDPINDLKTMELL